MRRPFAIITVLAAIAAACLLASTYEARFFTRMAARDVASGRFPRRHLACDVEEPDLGPALAAFCAADADDPLRELAAVEMAAAGVLSPDPDPAAVTAAFRRLADKYGDNALIHYRFGAYLLTRLQQAALALVRSKPASADAYRQGRREAERLAVLARREFAKAAEFEPQNSLFCYETAYSHLALGEIPQAVEWCREGAARERFDSGDAAVMSATTALVTSAGLPPLEGLAAMHKVAQFSPSYMAGRMEALVAGLLSDGAILRLDLTGEAVADHITRFQDLSDKLFQSAEVIRQSQASFVTAGLTWRKADQEARLQPDGELLKRSRRRLAEASYRYLLVGLQRSGAGLMPQQSVIELDIPMELHLPLSRRAEDAARLFLIAGFALLVASAGAGAVALFLKRARRAAVCVATLSVFVTLAYAACFAAVGGERCRVAAALQTRVQIICNVPEYLRAHGQPATRADFRADVAKAMLFSLDYTAQAGKVLAYIGTRDCFDTLVEALASPRLPRPSEVVYVLEDAAGEDFGYRTNGSRAANNDAIAALHDWWRANRQSFPEAPVEVPTPG